MTLESLILTKLGAHRERLGPSGNQEPTCMCGWRGSLADSHRAHLASVLTEAIGAKPFPYTRPSWLPLYRLRGLETEEL